MAQQRHAKKRTSSTKTARTNRKIAIASLVMSVACLTIAFAVMTSNLMVSGISRITGGNWDIHFSNQTSSATGGAEITSQQVDNTNITFLAVFTGINQSVEVDFDCTNSGDLNAILSSIVTTGDSDLAAKHISYSLQYTDSTAVAVDDTLVTGDSRPMKLILNYNATYAEWLIDQGSEVYMSITLVYSQDN